MDRRHRHQPGPGSGEPAQNRDETDRARRPGGQPDDPLGGDGGDVTYPHFLINGRVPADPDMRDYHAGQRIRLRVINAGSDTAFRVAVPDALLNVIATDGYPVMPAQAKSVILGMGERFDATFTVDKSVPVVAVPEGKQGHAQLNIRVGNAPTTVKVDDFVDAVRNEVPLDTATLSPTPEVTLPARTPDQLIEVRLSGPGNGYTWPFNGKLYDPTKDGIGVKRDQRVRIRMINESMMFHPIHLHGHTFQVVGDNGPLATKGHRAGAAEADRGGRLRHRQPRQVDHPLPQHISPGRRYGRLDLLRGLDVNRPVCY